jgi:hypothetical protein
MDYGLEHVFFQLLKIEIWTMANYRKNLVSIHLLWGIDIIGHRHHLDLEGMYMLVTLSFYVHVTTIAIRFGLQGP